MLSRETTDFLALEYALTHRNAERTLSEYPVCLEIVLKEIRGLAVRTIGEEDFEAALLSVKG